MKSKWVIVFIVILFLTSVIFIGVKSIHRIYKGQLLPRLRPLVVLVLPPKDLFTPLVSEPIDISVSGRTYSYTFSHRYAGKHEMSITVEKGTSMASAENSPLDLSVNCFDGEKAIFHKVFKGEGSPFWGRNVMGFQLFTYQVPTEMPIDVQIRCDVKANSPSIPFSKAFGRQKIVFEKASEL